MSKISIEPCEKLIASILSRAGCRVDVPGREQTEQEFRGLYAVAGFRLTRSITTTAGISIIEGIPM